ncbi:hypothetical protein GCM10010249_15410 [Streptomyces roseolilacinus]|uniref:Uncharacterized protein n=1 Tax=Streptomyces roseolilacinus TaxID=66904 RepID=A0A918EKD1_9ACTN|nr:hypothetical protein GCM10010249_15410 [Streptomyces roseolilacinus]
MDLADDLAGVDEEQTFLAPPGIVWDVYGKKLDCPVCEDPAAQAAGDAASAGVLGAGRGGRRRRDREGRAQRGARGRRVLSVHEVSCAQSSKRYPPRMSVRDALRGAGQYSVAAPARSTAASTTAKIVSCAAAAIMTSWQLRF